MNAISGDPVVAPVGAGWGWMLGYGILSVLLGLAAFAWPFSATYAATLVVGAFLIAAGIVSIASGLFGRAHDAWGYALLFGIVSLLIGIIMAFEPLTGALSLTILVAVWLATRGVLELMWSARVRRRRGWLAVLGIVNIILAIIIVATVPWSALTLPGYILGISFLLGGATAIGSALDHKRGAVAFG